jgi:hypothetical protein
MIRGIQHNCARSYTWTMAALETGVNQKADLVLCRSRRGRKGESESVTQRMKLENQRQFGQRCAVYVALQRTNGLERDGRGS